MKLYVYLLVLVSIGCNNTTSSILSNKYDDGTYCATITYDNPNTGTSSTYTLNVEVENNELTKILWNNGGWLDDSHFTTEELDENGFCSFTSDKGNAYTVQIIGQECGGTDNSRYQSDKEDEKCPKCYGEKDSYDTYCNTCKDKIENTCSRCGGFEYYVYGGVCNSCEDKERNDEEEERRERERKSREENDYE